MRVSTANSFDTTIEPARAPGRAGGLQEKITTGKRVIKRQRRPGGRHAGRTARTACPARRPTCVRWTPPAAACSRPKAAWPIGETIQKVRDLLVERQQRHLRAERTRRHRAPARRPARTTDFGRQPQGRLGRTLFGGLERAQPRRLWTSRPERRNGVQFDGQRRPGRRGQHLAAASRSMATPSGCACPRQRQLHAQPGHRRRRHREHQRRRGRRPDRAHRRRLPH